MQKGRQRGTKTELPRGLGPERTPSERGKKQGKGEASDKKNICPGADWEAKKKDKGGEKQ